MVKHQDNKLVLISIEGMSFPCEAFHFEWNGWTFSASVQDFDNKSDAEAIALKVREFFIGNGEYPESIKLVKGVDPSFVLIKPDYLFPGWGS